MAGVLVVVAHSDDESFGAGASLASAVDAGELVRVLVLSDGVSSRLGRMSQEAEARRRGHFEAACKVLGAEPLYRPIFSDQRSDQVAQLSINKWVEQWVEDVQPETALTHHVGDLNLDHRRVAEAVLVATRGLDIRILCMAPEWPTRCVGPAWAPTLRCVPTPESLERKIAACLCYVDELRPSPHPRSEQFIREHPDEWFMEVR